MTGTLTITPLTRIIKLADHTWTDIVTPVVELFFQLIFEQLALFFNY